jgi:serine/threonine protein kinase
MTDGPTRGRDRVKIGDFRIESRLGAGGMGIVYRARQVSLDRVVALKLLGAALTREADRARFQREAQAVAKLNHPGIASVYFIGQDRQVCYMAMEFIDGLTLREVIDRLAASHDAALTIDLALGKGYREEAGAREERFDRPTADHPCGAECRAEGDPAGPESLTPEAKQRIVSRAHLRRCCEVAVEAALALAHAHERGVVHRDIKPENILIDRQGRVHLIDFGVARFFEDASLTNTGALVGTPMYMSPEQVTGHLALDNRTDIYSLGLVLYELLTLARPIAAPTREGILRQIVTKAMSPASWRNPSLPRDLEGVLHKAAAKDPDDRYSTALELAADLRRWLDGRPVTALPYRYRLDPREIKAERPAGIMALTFAYFLASVFSASCASWLIFMNLRLSSEEFQKITGASGVNDPSVRALRFRFVMDVVEMSISSAAFLVIGLGLLAANRWARWVSIAVSSALASWALYGMIRELHQGPVSPALGFEVEFGFEAVLLAVTVSTIAYLSRRSVRDWFRLAARLRAEHRRGPRIAAGRERRH